MAIEIILRNPEPNPVVKFLGVVVFFIGSVYLFHSCGF